MIKKNDTTGASLAAADRRTNKPDYKQLKNEQRSRYKVTAKVPYRRWGLTV